MPTSALGHSMRQKHFAFDSKYTPLNHGSYGAIRTVVRDYQRSLLECIDSRADPFIRFVVPELLFKSRAAATSLLGAPIDDVVFVPNAATANNTVLRNLSHIEGDKILNLSTAYGSCEKTIEYVCETTSATRRCIDVTFPIENAALEQLFRQVIRDVQSNGSQDCQI